MKNIFVTGASGNIGSQLVSALKNEKGVKVTVAGRNPEKLEHLFPGTTATSFDFGQPATFAAAAKHDAVFLLGPPLVPDLFNLLEPFVDYLIANDRPHVVYLSAYGMEHFPELPFHGQMEEKLAASGLEFTILRPGFFASNFSNYERESIEQRGIIFNPAGAGKTPFIAPEDIAEVAAKVMTSNGHSGKTYILTGPEAFDMHQVAQLISEIIGKPIIYPEPSNEAYREALIAGGAPPFIADYMIPVYNLIKEGAVANVSSTVQSILQRPPTDLKTVLQKDFA